MHADAHLRIAMPDYHCRRDLAFELTFFPEATPNADSGRLVIGLVGWAPTRRSSCHGFWVRHAIDVRVGTVRALPGVLPRAARWACITRGFVCSPCSLIWR